MSAARRILLASVLLALLPQALPAQPPFEIRLEFSNPVDRVRQALFNFRGAPDAKKAQEELNAQLKALRGIGQIAQALQLPEWDHGQIPAPDLPVPQGREDLARRFEEKVRDALTKGDRERQCAAATLVAEMAQNEDRRANGVRGPDPDRTLTDLLVRLLSDIEGLSKSKDVVVRESAARALGRFFYDREKPGKVLEKFLGDEELAVRRVAAEGLLRLVHGGETAVGGIGPPEPQVAARLPACAVIVPVAAKGLNDKDEMVRRHCLGAIRSAAGILRGQARGLMMFGPFPGGRVPLPAERLQLLRPTARAIADAVPAIATVASGAESTECVRSCQALEAIATAGNDLRGVGLSDDKDPLFAALKKDAVPALKKCAGHTDIEVRLAALYALEEFGPDAAPAAAPVVKDLADGDPFVRWAATRVLGKMAPAEAKEVVPALAARVADEKNGDVRITALAALVRYGAEARPAVKAVTGLMQKGDEQTRLWAVRVLAAVGLDGKTETTGPLIDALSAKEVDIRRVAIGALARFGKPDKATSDALRTALADADSEVRRIASEALLAD